MLILFGEYMGVYEVETDRVPSKWAATPPGPPPDPIFQPPQQWDTATWPQSGWGSGQLGGSERHPLWAWSLEYLAWAGSPRSRQTNHGRESVTTQQSPWPFCSLQDEDDVSDCGLAPTQKICPLIYLGWLLSDSRTHLADSWPAPHLGCPPYSSTFSAHSL